MWHNTVIIIPNTNKRNFLCIKEQSVVGRKLPRNQKTHMEIILYFMPLNCGAKAEWSRV